ncbi:protein translocase SEC61 complex subunit gamma [Candidatus Pacearchaeota archaeon]|nr:protein translocase SEC61 complex subunit gamma [Candidatus Pacearchaeota archaeon]
MVKKTFGSLKSFTLKSKRVWHVMKKPSRKEFETIAKVSAIGILLLGLIGFAISLAMKMFV